jgi:hypothetical protein
LPPPNADFDYQIGEPYDTDAGVVTRDWFDGEPSDGSYSICYVNAFQTQDDDPDTDRPDERTNWPKDLVLSDLGDDPEWGGEYLIDISTADSRSRAAAWLEPMISTCADKGFDAVEFDNLDSWTRFDDTLEGSVPFGRRDAVLFASILVGLAQDRGLPAGQKNTPRLGRESSLGTIGFDFAVVEECGRYDECDDYLEVFGDHIVAIEYTDEGFAAACESAGGRISIVLRDRDVTAPGSPTYVRDTC